MPFDAMDDGQDPKPSLAFFNNYAKVYGGGGHKHSAGFQISRLEDLR